MSDSCSCGCSCGHDDHDDKDKDKVDDLKKAIIALGFDVSETENGEIKISKKD